MRIHCIDIDLMYILMDDFMILSGGHLALFTVERSDGSATRSVDVLACGNGQWGGLGNSLFNNAQSTPVKSKNVSGLVACMWTSFLLTSF